MKKVKSIINWLKKHLNDTRVIIALIGFLGGYWGFIKYLDEQKNTYYKETIARLFSEDKNQKLAAIATLGIYIDNDMNKNWLKSSFKWVKNQFSSDRYETNSINVLVNSLYTELDYNILNAVKGVLSKVEANKAEYVINAMIAINRNFFMQKYPIGNIKTDLSTYFDKLRDSKKLLKDRKEDSVLVRHEKITMQRYEEYEKASYDYATVKWHSLRSTDFLFMFLSEMSKSNKSQNFDLEFYQNNFDEGLINQCTLNKCKITRCSFENCSLSDVTFDNLQLIDNTIFFNSSFSKCSFKNGTISNSLFDNTKLPGTSFQEVTFGDVFFLGADLTNTTFENIKGLNPIYFYKAENIDKATFINYSLDTLKQELNKLNDTVFINYIEKSNLSTGRRDDLLLALIKKVIKNDSTGNFIESIEHSELTEERKDELFISFSEQIPEKSFKDFIKDIEHSNLTKDKKDTLFVKWTKEMTDTYYLYFIDDLNNSLLIKSRKTEILKKTDKARN